MIAEMFKTRSNLGVCDSPSSAPLERIFIGSMSKPTILSMLCRAARNQPEDFLDGLLSLNGSSELGTFFDNSNANSRSSP